MKFTIIDNDTQTTKVIDSDATTVAELKRDLRVNGFSTENKTISEGLTHIEFKTDDAVLPHDVPWNGGTTNNLVFRLTKAQKHINSGADRGAVYAQIKKLGLADAIKKKYGKNFTMCKTADLEAEIEAAEKSAPKKSPAKPEAKPAEVAAAPAKTKAADKGGDCIVKQAVVFLTNTLVKNGTITLTEGEKIAGILGIKLETAKDAIYSRKEIENMFRNM